MKAIMKRVGQPPVMEEIENELKAFQDAVGGYIETVQIARDLLIICDEEGVLKGKDFNCRIAGYPFFGDLVLVGFEGEEFADVPCDVRRLENMRLFA